MCTRCAGGRAGSSRLAPPPLLQAERAARPRQLHHRLLRRVLFAGGRDLGRSFDLIVGLACRVFVRAGRDRLVLGVRVRSSFLGLVAYIWFNSNRRVEEA